METRRCTSLLLEATVPGALRSRFLMGLIYQIQISDSIDRNNTPGNHQFSISLDLTIVQMHQMIFAFPSPFLLGALVAVCFHSQFCPLNLLIEIWGNLALHKTIMSFGIGNETNPALRMARHTNTVALLVESGICDINARYVSQFRVHYSTSGFQRCTPWK